MKKPVLVIMAAGMGSRYGGLKQIDPVDPEGLNCIFHLHYIRHISYSVILLFYFAYLLFPYFLER